MNAGDRFRGKSSAKLVCLLDPRLGERATDRAAGQYLAQICMSSVTYQQNGHSHGQVAESLGK